MIAALPAFLHHGAMAAPLLLAGDLGGTKTLLALAEARPEGPVIRREARYASREHDRFDTLLADFLAGTPVAAACFGLAGPTDGERAQLTYLPWHLDAGELAARHRLGRVLLANDFAAAAHGLDLLGPGGTVTLQAGNPVADGPRVVLGAGTGLGVAGLLRREGRTVVVPGEGGHMGFSPQDGIQLALWQALHAENGRVTAEDVVSGPGLARVHRHLHGLATTPEAIGAAALAGDAAARATVDLWLAAYGAFAGDVALQWLARGGVFIAGGIAGKLLPHLPAAPFLAAFNAKREHAGLAAAMPIRLVTEERLGLLGALALAAAAAG